jgi:hypothetical protein
LGLRDDRCVSNTEDDLRLTFVSKAAQVLPPIARDLVAALELEPCDPAQLDAVGDALAAAFMQGTAVGATEMVAQAAERGVSINLSWLGGPSES